MPREAMAPCKTHKFAIPISKPEKYSTPVEGTKEAGVEGRMGGETEGLAGWGSRKRPDSKAPRNWKLIKLWEFRADGLKTGRIGVAVS